MFSECVELSSLDVSKFDTSNVEDMSYMFASCRNIPSLVIDNFEGTNLKDMSHMFGDDYGLYRLSMNNSLNNPRKSNNLFSIIRRCLFRRHLCR